MHPVHFSRPFTSIHTPQSDSLSPLLLVPSSPPVMTKLYLFCCHPFANLRRPLFTRHIRSRFLRRPVCTASAPSTPSTTMKYNQLGSSDLLVSDVCLGTMTWGVQNTEADAHAQLEYAISRGVNFLDTAEIYPVPSSARGQRPGTTEQYIGTYLANNSSVRSKLIIATKVAGFIPSSETAANRYDPPKQPYPDARHDTQSILDACEGSLRRLQTDYIDLYQLHWPDRYVPLFGARAYNPQRERDTVPLRETLLALKHLLDVGKIRAYGLSNETTFGVCEIVRIADEIGMPRPATIQNSFCLLNRSFESELAEACAPSNYNIGLLPWSILCGGVLTGKYNGKKLGDESSEPEESIRECRFGKFPTYQGRFTSVAALSATAQYMSIANEHGMSAATLAQAFCKSRYYIPSSIIGATNLDQLKENIDAFEIDLNDDVLAKIDHVHNSNKDCIIRD